jgi:hypothetical protein
MTKKCSKCKVEKDLNLFYKSNTVKAKYQGYCKECHLSINTNHVSKIRLIGPTIHPESKTCGICNTKKPISQFGVKTAVRDGRLPYCKPCWIGYVKKATIRKRIRDSKA